MNLSAALAIGSGVSQQTFAFFFFELPSTIGSSTIRDPLSEAETSLLFPRLSKLILSSISRELANELSLSLLQFKQLIK
jgi:hypothetical protein